ncbi:MAG: ABC-F family ATP-binding cassette domain-containing protein [bacterium]
MAKEETILRFEGVSFGFGHNKPILKEVNFNVRRGAKFALMGQNGAGKSTLFGLIVGDTRPESGTVHTAKGLRIATARQVIPREQLSLSVREFFEACFKEKVYAIDPKIEKVLEAVHLVVPFEKKVKELSGGQQARLLLASALIQDADLLLLDEPTNNLDTAGIEHLRTFLIEYKKTVVVISHDAEFLNAFTQGVLYLDVHTHQLEQYVGNYFDVVADITARIEKENRKNAQLAREIQANKDKSNFFANKGGQMRLVARRMRDKAEELEEQMVDVRKEDKTIRSFRIPAQEELIGEVLGITSYSVMYDHKPVTRKAKISLNRGGHLLLQGPNGVGKSTLLESLVTGEAKGSTIQDGVRVGYYRQDFSTLDFDQTVGDALLSVMAKPEEEKMRSTAAGFLLTGEQVRTKIGSLSEGQKGLVAFAQLVLLKPGLLILDEPTNHINFRHIPAIAEALSAFEGAMVLVSHVGEFVAKIRIDEILDLRK